MGGQAECRLKEEDGVAEVQPRAAQLVSGGECNHPRLAETGHGEDLPDQSSTWHRPSRVWTARCPLVRGGDAAGEELLQVGDHDGKRGAMQQSVQRLPGWLERQTTENMVKVKPVKEMMGSAEPAESAGSVGSATSANDRDEGGHRRPTPEPAT